jgi:hypothetical protein
MRFAIAAAMVMVALAPAAAQAPPPLAPSLAKLQSDLQAAQAAIQADLNALAAAAANVEAIPLTMITSTQGSLLDGCGTTWTLDPTGLVLMNGKPNPPGWQTHEMILAFPSVEMLGLDGNWYEWSYASASWQPAPPPPSAVLPAKP